MELLAVGTSAFLFSARQYIWKWVFTNHKINMLKIRYNYHKAVENGGENFYLRVNKFLPYNKILWMIENWTATVDIVISLSDSFGEFEKLYMNEFPNAW